MSKFKVGDKVALATKSDEEIGEVNHIVEDRYGCHVFVAFNKKKVYEMQLVGYNYDEDKLVKVDDVTLSNAEIYNMLEPKLNNADVLKYGYYYNDHTMFNADETIKAIALAYRSGYLRAKKGRPFKIGGEKE